MIHWFVLELERIESAQAHSAAPLFGRSGDRASIQRLKYARSSAAQKCGGSITRNMKRRRSKKRLSQVTT
jgi:hypothetical protein